MKRLILLLGLLCAQMALAEGVKPLALIWSGKGTCLPGCLEGAKTVARKAGFEVKLIDENTPDWSILRQAKLWIQPGGVAVTAAESMGPALMQEVRTMILNGAGYVGFCAGAFLATAEIGTSSKEGLGIIPGSTQLWNPKSGTRAMVRVSTPKYGPRSMYFAGGPNLSVSEDDLIASEGEVIARYNDGSIAGFRGRYGQGKVAITGFHPEAGPLWKFVVGFNDPDGSDVFFAVDMAKFAGSL